MTEKKCHIEVTVRAEYAETHSDTAHEHYVFIYDITIRNNGSLSAQLLRRHWLITDAEENVQEVEGEGVIGEQPDIQPGGTHRYQSYCVLPTPIGCMQGSYRMRAADGTLFDAPIPAFTLAVPGSLN